MSAHHLGHGRNNAIEVGVAEVLMNRERDAAPNDVTGDWEAVGHHLRMSAVAVVVEHQTRVVDPAADASRTQLLDQLVATETSVVLDEHGVLVPDVVATGHGSRRDDSRNFRQAL